MARIARVVAPGLPHHVTQRGNRRLPTFFSDEDYATYVELMAASCDLLGVTVWAYCLMPNHVHLIVVPESEDGLRRAIGDAHRRYSRSVNFREGWRGHLWQGRFASYPLDETHALVATRYVELNPVRAGLVERPELWRWSSAAAHVGHTDDGLCDAAAMADYVDNWIAFLDRWPNEDEVKLLRLHERTGRPLGSERFTIRLEHRLSRVLRPRKRGPKPKSKARKRETKTKRLRKVSSRARRAKPKRK